MHVFKVACQKDTEPYRSWRGLKLQPASLVRPVTLESRVSKGLLLPTIAVSGCLFSKFFQRPRIGHLLQSTQSRFTQLHQHRPCRRRCGWVGALKCLSGEAFRDWPDRKVASVKGLASPDYERRFRAPERSFSMGTSRIPNHDHEHRMWKQDRYILVPE